MNEVKEKPWPRASIPHVTHAADDRLFDYEAGQQHVAQLTAAVVKADGVPLLLGYFRWGGG